MAENKKLERNSNNKVIGGVCSGLADYFNIDVALMRVAFVIALLFASFGFWLYIILWIVIPIDGQPTTDNRQQTTDNGQRSTDNGQPTTVNQEPESKSKTTSIFVGISVIFIGLIFLINNFLPISWIWKLWPLILVVIGVVMIVNATKKGNNNE